MEAILGWLITGMCGRFYDWHRACLETVKGIWTLSIAQEFKTKGPVTKTLIPMAALIGYLCNTYLMPSPLLNFILMGMAFSATFANMVTEERLQKIIADFNPFLGVAMIIVILNLGAPLDYHAILGAGVYRNSGFCSGSTGTGVRGNYSGNDCGSSCFE